MRCVDINAVHPSRIVLNLSNSMLKKLISQTAVYGLSSMLGRFINFLLVIPHTRYLKSVNDYGDLTTVFAFVAFLNIILTYGLETSYFKFIRNGHSSDKVFGITQRSIYASTAIFLGLAWIFRDSFSEVVGMPGNTEVVLCCISFLCFDTLCALPFASLRHAEKPLHFASIKLINILINVGLNLLFLIKTPSFLADVPQVVLVLSANSIASFVTFLILSPIALKVRGPFDFGLYKEILKYSWPLVFVGLAGMVNETLDRTLIRHLLPGEEGAYQNGIYGAFYKLTMVMTMFVQAFRFAAEPLFFKQVEAEDTRKMYAVVLYWFIAVCTFIFLLCMLFIEPLAELFIKDKEYFKNPDGLAVVPILLMANLFLGIYYNVSIWYRLTNNTMKGAIISGIGAIVTISLNLILIPYYGFKACAWITLGVYFLMCGMAYLWGRSVYPIPYFIGKYLVLIIVGLVLWNLYTFLGASISNILLSISIKILLAGLLLLIIWMLQPKRNFA